jgi:integrase
LVEDLAADDFEQLRADIAKVWGPVRLGNEVQRVRTFFKYGYEAGLIDKPVRFGPSFKKPSASVLRRHRVKGGERMLKAAELRTLLDAAPVQLKAMRLLGVNCAFNCKDCADVPLAAVDLDVGWLNFARVKTGIDRRCPLWAETVEALKAAIAARPEPREEAAEGLLFVTTKGRPWLSRGQANPVCVAIRNLMKAAGIHRASIGFATLRHVFRTVTRDFPAVRLVMGHADNTIDDIYREGIEDDRLRAVVDHVHGWLISQNSGAQ